VSPDHLEGVAVADERGYQASTDTVPIVDRRIHCWHKPFPPDYSSFCRRTPRTLADLRGLRSLVAAFTRVKAG
jgi:hypothetical protein